MTWSSTPCTPKKGGGKGYKAVTGSTIINPTHYCAGEDTENYAVARCCADVIGCTLNPDGNQKYYTEPPTQEPTRVPTPEPTHVPLPVPTPKPTSDGCSEKTCEELGWPIGTHGVDNVCAESEVVLDREDDQAVEYPRTSGLRCSGDVTFRDAFRLCDDLGARLCGIDELAADEARGSGCNYDHEMIWSFTVNNVPRRRHLRAIAREKHVLSSVYW